MVSRSACSRCATPCRSLSPRVSIWSRFRPRRGLPSAGSWTTENSSTSRTEGRARRRRSSTRCSSKKSRCARRSRSTITASRCDHAREFLNSRDKVKVTVTFRGREIAHQDIGHKLIQKVIAALADVASVESAPRSEGRTLTAVLMPKPAKPAREGRCREQRDASGVRERRSGDAPPRQHAGSRNEGVNRCPR